MEAPFGVEEVLRWFLLLYSQDPADRMRQTRN